MELDLGLFYMGVKHGLPYDGENTGWWLFKGRELRKMFGSRTKQQKGAENCTLRGFIICKPWEILFRSSNKGG
jgi:hypothetical protein